MKNAEKKYFQSLSAGIDLEDQLGSISDSDGLSFKYPLMPRQYCYVHNLKTGKFENVNGVEQVLGYPDLSFTLELYYQSLHSLDRKLIFETTRKNIDAVNKHKILKPFDCQLTVLYRIKRQNGQYAKILRYSTLLASESMVTKTFSLCTDVSGLGLLNDVASDFVLPGQKPYDGKLLLNQLHKEKFGMLSHREMQILELIIQGNTTKGIALFLSISPLTVNKHRQNILKKTRCENFQEITRELISMESNKAE